MSSSTVSLKRGLKMSQPQMRMLQVDVEAASSAVSGFDKNQIKSIVKNGAGDFTIILKRPFSKKQRNKAKCFVMPLSAGVTYHLAAADHDRVNVILSADVDFSIIIMGSDYRLTV